MSGGEGGRVDKTQRGRCCRRERKRETGEGDVISAHSPITRSCSTHRSHTHADIHTHTHDHRYDR